MTSTEKLNPKSWEANLGALVLRVTVGGLFLLHGVSKMTHGVEGMQAMLGSHGIPGFVAYGVFVGEVLAPLLLILGVAMRSSAAAITITMLMAVYLVHSGDVFTIGDHGEYALELQLLYAVGAIAAALMGPGRWAVPTRGFVAKL